MIKLRLLAAAMLFHGDDLLMMKRSPNRTLSPSKWGIVGGHMEPEELSSPRATVLREIEEETGLLAKNIQELTLRYILIRLNGQEIRQQFIYVGRVTKREVTDTEEGELHWIPGSRVLDRDLPFIFRLLLEHYYAQPHCSHIWLGTASAADEAAGIAAPHVRWQTVTDPGLN